MVGMVPQPRLDPLAWVSASEDLDDIPLATFAVFVRSSTDFAASTDTKPRPVFVVLKSILPQAAAREGRHPEAIAVLDAHAHMTAEGVFRRVAADQAMNVWLRSTMLLHGNSGIADLIWNRCTVHNLASPLPPITTAFPGTPILLVVLTAPPTGAKFASPDYPSSWITLRVGDGILLGPNKDIGYKLDSATVVVRYYVQIGDRLLCPKVFPSMLAIGRESEAEMLKRKAGWQDKVDNKKQKPDI